MDTLIISTLAQARIRKEAALAALKAKVIEFEKTPEYLTLKGELEQASAEEYAADETFRDIALAQYAINKEKHTDAYDVRDDPVVTIPNEAAAIQWSLKNFTPALKLDKKVFIDAIKKGTVPTRLGTYTTQPKIYIHSDLSAWH